MQKILKKGRDLKVFASVELGVENTELNVFFVFKFSLNKARTALQMVEPYGNIGIRHQLESVLKGLKNFTETVLLEE